MRSLFSSNAIRYQWRNNGPVFVTAILLICVVLWLLELVLWIVSPTALSVVVNYGALQPLTALACPWTFITSMFLHQPSSILHILFNMLALWSVGPVLERMMGHWSFLALYMLSGLGGGMGMMLWAVISPSGTGWITASYGASGALFGLFAAILIVYRRIGADITSMVVWMGINFLMPFVMSNVAWQAHLGGFVVGLVFTWLLVSGPRPLRGKRLAFRTAVYGITLLVLIVAVIVLCSLNSPLNIFSILL